MPFFNCDPCKRSFPVYTNLVMHYQTGDHKVNGDVCPAKADCQTDAVPPGYELRLPREAAHNPPPRPFPEPPNPDSLGQHGEEHQEGGGQGGGHGPHEETPQSERVRLSREEEQRGDELRKERRRGEPDGERRGKTRQLPYREMPEPANILKTILEDYPGMTDDIIDEIMSWVEVQGGVMDPMQVQYLLTQMANIPKGAATLVPAKYTLALQNAADQGQSEVLAAMDNWGGLNPMNGGMPRGFGRRVNPMNPMGGPMFGMLGGGSPGFGFDYRMGRRRPQPEERYQRDDYEEEPEYRPPRRRQFRDEGSDAPGSDSRVDRLEGLVLKLGGQIEELTTKKKEDALNARLDRIESEISGLVTAGGGRHQNDEGDPMIERLAAQIADLKTEIGNSKNSRLEEKLAELEQQFNDARNEKLVALQEQISDLKDSVKHPTGRTEMDVVADIATKALETVKTAGNDVRTMVMAQHAKEDFDPGRVPPDKRIKAGQELAAGMEKEARVTNAEEALLSLEKEK